MSSSLTVIGTMGFGEKFVGVESKSYKDEPILHALGCMHATFSTGKWGICFNEDIRITVDLSSEFGRRNGILNLLFAE